MKHRWRALATALGFGVFAITCSGQITAKEAIPAAAKAGMEISVDNGPVLYIPILDEDQMLALIPVRSDRYTAIQISGQMRPEGTTIDVLAFLATPVRKLPVKDCADLKGWKSRSGGHYTAKMNTTVTLSGIGELGLPPVTVKITPARPGIATSGNVFCTCGDFAAVPSPGKCMAPSGHCGWCCHRTTTN